MIIFESGLTPASQAPESSARAAKDSSCNADLAAKCARLEKTLGEKRKRWERDVKCLEDKNKTLEAQLAAAQGVSADAAGPSGSKRRRTENSKERGLFGLLSYIWRWRRRTEKVELPIAVWAKIAEKLDKNDVFSFALTCKQLREAQQMAGRKLETKTQWTKANGDGVLAWFSRSW